MCVCVLCVHACVHVLTSVVFVKGVHAGEVDGERLEGSREADAALGPLHVQPGARGRARVGRLGQPRRGILHSEYGARRLDRRSGPPTARGRGEGDEETHTRSYAAVKGGHQGQDPGRVRCGNDRMMC